MIKFKPRSNGPKFFISSEVNHPEQTGTGYVEYTLTHNFGTTPDKILMDRYEPTVQEWIQVPDIFDNGFGFYQYAVVSQTSYNVNVSKVRAYRISPGTWKLRFKCFMF